MIHQLARIAGSLHFPQPPDGFLVAPLVTCEELRHADGRTRLKDSIDRDQSGESSCGISAPTESEDEDVVAIVVVLDEPLVGQANVVVEPLPEHTAENAVDADRVVDKLRLLVFALRRAQRPHAPDVRISFDAVPGAVEEERETLLLLLRAGEAGLSAALLCGATDDHADPDDGCDGKQQADRVAGSLDESQDLLHGVPLPTLSNNGGQFT